MVTGTIVVTGGAGGIGLAIARLLASEGRKVVIIDKNPADPSEISRGNGAVFAEVFDLVETGKLEALALRLEREHGPITGLVNNAGICKPCRLEDTSERDWNEVLLLNLTVPFLLIKYLAPVIRANGGGAIVNMASRNAIRSTVGRNAYDASKSGLLGLTRTAAGELAKDKIRVNAVCPGVIDTAMAKSNGDDPSGVSLKSVHSKLVPMGRYGQVEEVADVVAFLLSEKSRFITGSAIVADGGQLACMDNDRLMEITRLR